MLDQRIVLPGGAGLVGQNLVVRLKQRGFHNILVIDKHQANLQKLAHLHPDVEVSCQDLSAGGGWEADVKSADCIVMLQAQIGGKHQQEFERNNLDASQRILDAVAANSSSYLVHISSSVVESVAEDFYSWSKREQERLVVESGIDCPVLRPTLMYGWFDRKHLGWLARFMQRVPVFPIPGKGDFMRQPLYAGDFCAIILSCIEQRRGHGVFNISGHERIDYVEIIREIRRVTGSRSRIVHLPYGLFRTLLQVWGMFDPNPPFTVQQLEALCADDEFEVIDWPGIFGVRYTPFSEAIAETFNHPEYSKVILEF